MPVGHGEFGCTEQYSHSLVTLAVLPVRAEESQCIVFVKCCFQVLLGLSADLLHSEDIECIVLYGGNQSRKPGAPYIVGILVKVGHSDIVSAYPELGCLHVLSVVGCRLSDIDNTLGCILGFERDCCRTFLIIRIFHHSDIDFGISGSFCFGQDDIGRRFFIDLGGPSAVRLNFDCLCTESRRHIDFRRVYRKVVLPTSILGAGCDEESHCH